MHMSRVFSKIWWVIYSWIFTWQVTDMANLDKIKITQNLGNNDSDGFKNI